MCEDTKKAPASLATSGLSIETLNDRLKRYSKAHKRSIAMADYINEVNEGQDFVNNEYSKIANKLHHCGSWLTFKHYYTVDDVRLVNADFCKMHTLCPLCAIRRGAKSLKTYLDKTEILFSEDEKLTAWFITFTVKDGEDLKERYEHLRESRNKMADDRRRHISNPNRPKNESCKALGGVSSIEIKRGKNSGLWHPHIHEIWLTHDDIDQEALSKEWSCITEDSFIVDARKCYGSLSKSFSEVFKYALKFSDMDFEDNWEAYHFCKGKNLMNSFGNLRGLKVSDDLTDDSLELLPYVLLMYKHVGGNNFDAQYSCIKSVRIDADNLEKDYYSSNDLVRLKFALDWRKKRPPKKKAKGAYARLASKI